MPALGGEPLGHRHPERRAQDVGLDVVGGEAVPGEEHVDPAGLDQTGDVGRPARVDDGRPAHCEDLAAGLVGGADAVGDLLHHQRLGLLRGHLAAHELEGRRPSRLGRRMHPHPTATDDDLVADAHPVHRDRAGPAVGDHDGAVHLRVLDGQPPALDPHVGGQVGGGVEVDR